MKRPSRARFPGWDDIWPTVGEPGLIATPDPVRFCIAPRGRTWEVLRDARFWGTFSTMTEARDCVRDEMQRLFSGGSAAELRIA